MDNHHYRLSAVVWLYPGMAGWHFVTIPKDISEDITNLFGDRKRGWGSLPVKVTMGDTFWQTSIFPDKKQDAYLMPLKAEIRKKGQIKAGDNIQLVLEVAV